MSPYVPRQTSSEGHLVAALAHLLPAGEAGIEAPRILNIGAGRSVSIERQLVRRARRFVSDRVDVEPCAVDHPAIGTCHVCPVEAMTPLPAAVYRAAFANFVLEHVQNPALAAREIFRVLRPGGLFLATLSNPRAPEFRLARHTPLWLHRMVRRGEAWRTVYAYRDVPDLARRFEGAGFVVGEVRFFPCVESYLAALPPLGIAGRLYDRALVRLRAERCMGQACLAFAKPRDAP